MNDVSGPAPGKDETLPAASNRQERQDRVPYPGEPTSAWREVRPMWISPISLTLILAAAIFTAEALVMLLLPQLPPLPELAEAGVDAGLLVALLAPSLYFLLLRPMRRQIEGRESAARALEQSKAQLEQRVQERTAALAEAGQDVKDSLLALAKT